MRTRKSSYVHPPYKTKYRVENWKEYEKGLRDRGDVTIWFSEEAREAWTPPSNGRRGAQRQYSELAIETALTLRLVFHLPLRQSEGFVGSLLKLMDLDLTAPDHTTLSRRGSELEVALRRQVPAGPIQLIVDSTVDDAPVVEGLLDQVSGDIERFSANGAYDTWSIREALAARGATVMVPPSKEAVVSGRDTTAGRARDTAVARIGEVGGRLRSREPRAQKVEVRLGCNLLNKMLELGAAKSVAIAR